MRRLRHLLWLALAPTAPALPHVDTAGVLRAAPPGSHESRSWREEFSIGSATVSYGSETMRIRAAGIAPPEGGGAEMTGEPPREAAGGYVDGRVALPGAVDLELGLFHARWQEEAAGRRHTDPRLALAWRPLPDQLLRVASRSDMALPLRGTATPADALGLRGRPAPMAEGGISRSLQLRWDAGWGGGFATAWEYERQHFDRFAVELPDEGVLRLPFGRSERLAFDSTLALERNLTLSGRFTRQRGENPAAPGAPLPLLPDRELTLTLAWQPSTALRTVLGADWVGGRSGDAAAKLQLDPYLTTHFAAEWQGGGDLRLRLVARNLLDREFEAAAGVAGPGRELVIDGSWRF